MKVAIVGSGISGLGTAWILSQKHEVHLFEAAERLGGHANTVTIREPREQGAAQNDIPIDTGFLVYNELTYPHLTGFLKELQVETVDSDMSLSVQAPAKNLEWNGTNLNSIFGQRVNLLRPHFYKMLWEVTRFHREAESNRDLSRRHGWTLRDLLRERRYSSTFREDYLIPIGAAIWSTPEARMLDFPAETFITFFINHRLLQVNNRPVWKTVRNGSIQYVKKVAAKIPNIHLSSPVTRVERWERGVRLWVHGESLDFDRVVLATHAPVTARILKAESEEEQKCLSAIKDQVNRTLLHTDPSVMPQTRRCWASWNVLGLLSESGSPAVSLSYYANKLQPLRTQKDYFITLNPKKDPEGILREIEYSHPLFDTGAIRAQGHLPSLQGRGGVYFAGAWTRYGFHEDGLLSAVKIGDLFGLPTPWKVS